MSKPTRQINCEIDADLADTFGAIVARDGLTKRHAVAAAIQMFLDADDVSRLTAIRQVTIDQEAVA
jgi:hypothetical protein